VPVPENRRLAANALLLAGRSDLQRFVAARQAELDGAERDAHGKVAVGRATLELANRAAARFREARREVPGEATTQMALLHQWLDQPGEALKELEQGLREAPGETLIHDAYIQWMRERGHFDALVGAYAQLVRENPTTPILRWHQGRAVYTRADKLRQDGNFLGALAAYGKADGMFGEYLAMVPGHADAANQWRALCQLSIARCAVDMGDLTAARSTCSPPAKVSRSPPPTSTGRRSWSTASAATSPAPCSRSTAPSPRAADTRWRTRSRSTKRAAAPPRPLGLRLQQRGPGRARPRRAEVANDGDAASREGALGTQLPLLREGGRLSPDDARIVNDCGLMLIYHLNRDLDRARELFDRAIASSASSSSRRCPPTPTRATANVASRRPSATPTRTSPCCCKEHQHKPFADYRRSASRR
jgi:tetratricopeptide (TPR) repeat protein